MRHPIVTQDLQAIVANSLPFIDLAGKVVVIAGANGFLPAYMVETLLYFNEISRRAPIQVVGLVRSTAKAEARLRHYLGRRDLHLIEQDVGAPIAIAGPVDYVIHAASQASPKYFGADPVGTLSANVFGTRNLLDLARVKQAAAFLFFSSAEVYGQMDADQIPTPETAAGAVDPLDVRSCYAESKRMGETLCIAWGHQYGVPAKIVRPFHTYGPGMALDDGRVFSDFVADVLQGRDLVLRSDGRAVRAYCYLSDAVAGFWTVLFRGHNGQAYNVGNNRAEASVQELAQCLVALFPKKHLRVRGAAAVRPPGYLPSAVHRVSPNTAKLEALGWRPRYGLAEGFERTIRSFLCRSPN